MRSIAGTAAILLALISAGAFADERGALRASLARGGNTEKTALDYSEICGNSADAELVAEYASALARAGWADAALSEMDRAYLLDSTGPEVRFLAGRLLEAAGLTRAGREIAGKPPAWAAKWRMKRLSGRPHGDFRNELLAANILLEKGRFVSAAVRLEAITKRHPGESLAWGAYAIALEKLGAFRAASAAADREAKLLARSDPDEAAEIRGHRDALKVMPKVTGGTPFLGGRTTLHLGGAVSRSGGTTSYAFSGQAGKFVSPWLNLGLSAGVATGSTVSLGLSGRGFAPLGTSSWSATAGTRLEWVSSASSLGWVLSPGLSCFFGASSLDFHFDVGVAGAQAGTFAFTIGFTHYLGGGYL